MEGGVEQDSESYSVACGTTIYPKEPEAILADDWGKQPIKDVAESPQEISENSSVVSKNHDEFSAVGQDQGGKSYPVQDVGIVEQVYESLVFACSTTIHDEQLEDIPAVIPAKTISLSNSAADFASVIGDTPKIQLAVVDMGKQQPIKDVIGGQEETSETSSVVSEAIGDEVGLSTMGQAFSAFSRSGLTNLTISSSDAQMIIRSIFDKHGVGEV